jgi:hypothetical protein
MIREIAHTEHLTAAQAEAVRTAAAANFETLDEAAETLRSTFPSWFIYRGGNHVALHLASGDSRRVLVIHEERAADDKAAALAEMTRDVRDGIARCEKLTREIGALFLVVLVDPRGDVYHAAKREGITFATLPQYENGTVLTFSTSDAAIRHAALYGATPEGYTLRHMRARDVFAGMIRNYEDSLRYIEQRAQEAN